MSIIRRVVAASMPAVVSAALAVSPLTASAHAAPAVVAPEHGANTNGCTLSPDSGYAPMYFNFHNACDWHDLCYHHKWYGNSSAGRLACDDGFRSRMRSWCANQYASWNPARYSCYGLADVYYRAVRTFGGSFF